MLKHTAPAMFTACIKTTLPSEEDEIWDFWKLASLVWKVQDCAGSQAVTVRGSYPSLLTISSIFIMNIKLQVLLPLYSSHCAAKLSRLDWGLIEKHVIVASMGNWMCLAAWNDYDKRLCLTHQFILFKGKFYLYYICYSCYKTQHCSLWETAVMLIH